MLRYNTEKEFLEGYLGDIQRNQNLGEEEYQILKKIISCEVFERIFGQTSIDEERIEQWKRALNYKCSNLEKQCRYGRNEIKSPMWSNLSKYAKNESKYIQKYSKRALMYLILWQMFQDKGSELFEYIASKCVYKKIGKFGRAMPQSFCPISPIQDLITGNLEKGKLYKYPPKDLRKKEEYNYGEDGKLLLYKHYRALEEKEDTIEFFLYIGEYILQIQYEILPEKERAFQVIRISMQQYDEEIISRTETAELYPKGIDVFYIEELEFYEEGLKYINESYQSVFIPGDNLSVMTNRREIYDFQKDEDGCLYGYKVSSWIGDGLVPSERKDRFYEISEKGKWDTQKGSGRWRRPDRV